MARNIFGGLWGAAIQLEIVSGWNTPNPTGNFSTVNVQVKLIASSYLRTHYAYTDYNC